jgi:acyl carrier protein
MSVQREILDYLKNVNPAMIERTPEPEALKLRRVLDSLDMVDFLAHLESTYAIKISDQDVLARNFETVGTVVEFVTSRRKG